jgi:hypothetical protein
MKILDRLPIYESPALVTVQGEVVEVRRNQIIVWLSVRAPHRTFPAILDTGLSHNLSMARRHAERWIGADLPRIGRYKIGTIKVEQFAADVAIHRNKPGTRELRDSVPHPLTMHEGISILPDELPIAPRIPILGLRTIMRNRLTLIVDGKRNRVTLKTGWR